MTDLSAGVTLPRLALSKETVHGLLGGESGEGWGAPAQKTKGHSCLGTCKCSYTCTCGPTWTGGTG